MGRRGNHRVEARDPQALGLRATLWGKRTVGHHRDPSPEAFFPSPLALLSGFTVMSLSKLKFVSWKLKTVSPS